jgi:hypothetical protein
MLCAGVVSGSVRARAENSVREKGIGAGSPKHLLRLQLICPFGLSVVKLTVCKKPEFGY